MSELKKAERLKETIKQAFEANENETELLVTADGNCFLPKDKNFAELHARSTMQKLETVTREDIIPSKKEKRIPLKPKVDNLKRMEQKEQALTMKK